MTFVKCAAATTAAILLGGTAMAAMNGSMPATVVEIVVGSKDHDTLEKAVIAAGLADTLSGAGPFTVFAPTDKAFSALPEETLAEVMKPENVDSLRKILSCHVVATKAMAAYVVALVEKGGGTADVTTIGNCRLQLSVKDGKVKIDDAITVTAADLAAGNGVVHVINGVLLPAS